MIGNYFEDIIQGLSVNHAVSSFHVLKTVENTELIVRGNKGSLKAVKSIGKNNWLVVVYREISKRDGFVITAYFLNKRPRGEVIWRRR